MNSIRGLHRLILFFIVIQSSVFADSCGSIGQNLWQPRPFSSYKAREILLLCDTAPEEQKLTFNSFSFATEYMRGFGDHTQRLGSLPFWSGTNTMTIGNNDGTSDLDAYQFGLGEAIAPGSITLEPKIQHVGTEILWRLSYAKNKSGFYYQMKAPIVAMMIENQVCETPARYSGEELLWLRYPCQMERFDSLIDSWTNGFDHREPDLKYGKLCGGRDTKIRLADLEMVFGYKIWSSDRADVGCGFKVSCPTGNVPDARTLLEPVVGRAGHWGVGGELYASCLVHESDRTLIDLRFHADLLHLTAGRRPHWRSFDLKQNGPGSKYMIIQRYVSVVLPNLVDGGFSCDKLPAEIIPAVRLTTIPVFSTISVEGSAGLMLDIQVHQWNVSLTTEVWGRSTECLKIDNVQALKYQEHALDEYAVLGRQVDTLESQPEVALNFCEPLARINRAVDLETAIASPGVPMDPNKRDKVKDATKIENRIPKKHEDALDIAGAQAPHAFTGKFTAEFGYTWLKNRHVPHVSFFIGAELANPASKFMNMWSCGIQGLVKF